MICARHWRMARRPLRLLWNKFHREDKKGRWHDREEGRQALGHRLFERIRIDIITGGEWGM